MFKVEEFDVRAPRIPENGLTFAGVTLPFDAQTKEVLTEAKWMPGRYPDESHRAETFALWVEDDKYARHELIINAAHWINQVFQHSLPGLLDEGTSFLNQDQNFARSEIFPKYIYNSLIEDYGHDMRAKESFRGGDFLADMSSLNRHVHSSGQLLQLVTERLSLSASTNQNLEAIKFCSEHNQYLAYSIGALHDVGRLVTQTSLHDEAGDLILELAGIIPEVKNSHHQPVPMTQNFDAENFDINPWHKLSRLADVFSKVINDDDFTLRTTVEQVVEYSRARQSMYYEKENNNPDSLWFGKSIEELQNYLNNEESALRSAVSWLDKCGVSWQDLLEGINRFDGSLDQYFKA